MKVVVCDDIKSMGLELVSLLNELEIIDKVDFYDTIDGLEEKISKEKYDIVFMDIFWDNDNKTGIEVIENISKIIPVIYVTNYPLQYIEKAFEGRRAPDGFIIKPVTKEQLEKQVERIYKKKIESNRQLAIEFKDRIETFSYNMIMYLESRLHFVEIHLSDGNVVNCKRKLSALKEQLSGNFIQSHKSFIVNADYIKELKFKVIELKNGETVPVSRSRVDLVKEEFMDYSLGRR